MNIIILDSYTANPGDLSWDPIAKLGNLTVYDRTPETQIISRAKNAEIILTNKTPLTKKTIYQLPKLKYIGVLATGVNVVDLAAAQEKNITVTNIPDYSSISVAQHVFALLLSLTNHVSPHSQTIKQGKWAQCQDFCYWDYPILELADKTLGIIGFGNIGQKVAQIATAFGMHILAYRQPQKKHKLKNINFTELDTLFQKSDVISLHCPLNNQTKEIINSQNLNKMKKTAFLINTGRGGLINEKDLANALNQEKIAGAGLDVLATEPPLPHNPLLNAKNCLITPHIAWASYEARFRLITIAAKNLSQFLNNKPLNLVTYSN